MERVGNYFSVGPGYNLTSVDLSNNLLAEMDTVLPATSHLYLNNNSLTSLDSLAGLSLERVEARLVYNNNNSEIISTFCSMILSCP